MTYHLDADLMRQLAYDRYARLGQEWSSANAAGPDETESTAVVQSRRARIRLGWLRTHLHLRPAGHAR